MIARSDLLAWHVIVVSIYLTIFKSRALTIFFLCTASLECPMEEKDLFGSFINSSYKLSPEAPHEMMAPICNKTMQFNRDTHPSAMIRCLRLLDLFTLVELRLCLYFYTAPLR